MVKLIVFNVMVVVGLYFATVKSQNCWNVPNSYPPDISDLPLCGNGILDPGEVCDDGNKLGGDGCNAWCSAYDAMTGTCTLAGKNSHCPFGRTVLGNSGAPSQSIFCDLRCIDASPDGQYVVFADAGTLVRMNLFTDQVASSLSILPASISQSFTPICSLAIFEPDSSIIVHECIRQRFLLLTSDGGISTLIVDLSAIFLPSVVKGAKATYFDKKARTAIVAGVPTSSYSNSGNQDWCVLVLSLDVPTQANYSSGSAGAIGVAQVPVLARIPCVAYNVVEGALIYPSFSVQGMQPKTVSLEPCMHMHMLNSLCYVVYMERSDMQFLRAYIPKNGGVDIAYAVSTNIMNNALGHPLVKYGSHNMIYTSLGACFQSESNIRTTQGRIPPAVTLGNACKNVPTLGLGCSTPFNNPFMTEIMTTPYLLPEGLSVANTHRDLSLIFSSKCQPLSSSASSLHGMVNTSGPMLYKNILQSTYANTTPVDFVEIPGIMDIVYITPTSVGLISTKRFTFYDRNNPGYCRATNLIYCPQNSFGDVKGGTCFSCANKLSPGFGVSVAWQIACLSSVSGSASSRRSLISASENAPYERFSSVVTRDISEAHVTASVCSFLTASGLPCPSTGSVAMTPFQQYNMAADAADSGLQITQPGSGGGTLIQCLIEEAEKSSGRRIFRSNSAEYSTTYVSSGTRLLLASANLSQFNARRVPTTTTITNGTLLSEAEYLNISKRCVQDIGLGLVRGWLSCSIPYFVNSTLFSGNNETRNNNLIARRRRHLLQQSVQTLQPSDSNMVVHQDLSLASGSSISWNNVVINSQSSQVNLGSGAGQQDTSSGFPIWLGVVIGVAGLAIVIALLFVFYCGTSFKKLNRRSNWD